MVELVQHVEEMTDGPRQTVARPDHDYVETSSVGIAHKLIEPRTLRLRARDLVCVLFDDFESALSGELA